MGVATAEINQPWLVNIGILYHWGYFHEVVDDLELIVLSIKWGIIYQVYFISAFYSAFLLFYILILKLFWFIYNFTIICLKLKYVLANVKPVNYTYFIKWDQTLKECSWGQLTKNKIIEHAFILSIIPLL